MSENPNRLSYMDAPLASPYDDPTVGWTALTAGCASGSVATLTVTSTATRFHQTLPFWVELGVRDATTGIRSNRELFKLKVLNATTFTVIARSDNTRSHAIGESLEQTITSYDMVDNPGPLTTTGSMPYLAASGAMAELLAPANGNYAVNFASSIPSYVSAPTWATLATPPTDTAFGTTETPIGSLVAGQDADLDPIIQGSVLGAIIGNQTNGTFYSLGVGGASSDTSGHNAYGLSGIASSNSVAYGVDATGWATANGSVAYGHHATAGAVGSIAAAGLYGLYIESAQLSGGATSDLTVGAWISSLAGKGTNVYSFWSDERGVAVLKAVNDFDSAYQANWRIYNPLFTKYTAGATNREYIVAGQWNGNVAEIGTVATGSGGGAGTLRGVKIIGASLDTPATLTANGVAVATQAYVNSQGFLTSVTNISGNAGTATVLQNARTINGTSFNGSANITVTADASTLTGTSLAATVVGSSLTSVGTIATGVWSGTAIAANKGGTGQTVYVVGDLLQASTTTALSALAAVATGNVLISGGVGTVSSWGKAGLTTHVSGVLPVANGGTNASSASITAFNNITGLSAAGTTGTTSTNLVFSTSPTFITPTLGAATATSLNGNTFTTGTYTLTGGAGKTLTFNQSITLAGTDAQTYTFPTTSATIARTDAANTFSGGMTVQVSAANKFIVDASFVRTNTALLVMDNGAGSVTGGVFESGRFNLPTGTYVGWSSDSNAYNGADTFFKRGGAAATLQCGVDANGAAVNQIIQAASGITGTDRTGGNLTINSGKGTGAGAVSSLSFGTPTVLASGTTAQSITARLTINSTTLTFAEALDEVFGTTTGTKHGTSTSQKQAWWGSTPVVQSVFATGASHTVDELITVLQTYGLVRQS